MAVVVTDRLYRGLRTKDHTSVTVHIAPGDNRPLTGHGRPFDWGRPTDGALALSDALAEDVFGAGASAELRTRLFHEIVLTLPFIDPWLLWRHELQEWAEKAA
ncbi:MAG TPA: hypothetical protein VGR61_02210 [Candidatus Dormibacteraeota bacterium]|nr:hypothetical protein [Candidatus Dormibacteraeota bacterium]